MKSSISCASDRRVTFGKVLAVVLGLDCAVVMALVIAAAAADDA
jgi:hypothetical protein